MEAKKNLDMNSKNTCIHEHGSGGISIVEL